MKGVWTGAADDLCSATCPLEDRGGAVHQALSQRRFPFQQGVRFAGFSGLAHGDSRARTWLRPRRRVSGRPGALIYLQYPKHVTPHAQATSCTVAPRAKCTRATVRSVQSLHHGQHGLAGRLQLSRSVEVEFADNRAIGRPFRTDPLRGFMEELHRTGQISGKGTSKVPH